MTAIVADPTAAGTLYVFSFGPLMRTVTRMATASGNVRARAGISVVLRTGVVSLCRGIGRNMSASLLRDTHACLGRLVAYRPPELATAWVSGQFTSAALDSPWLPCPLKSGIDAPATGQNDGPKTALVLLPVCCRSP